MEVEEDPHLGFEYMDNIHPSFLEDFRKQVYTKNIIHKEVTRPSDMAFMSIEWAIPTAVILYISKSYFDTILKELAKDHYKKLKEATSRLANKSEKKINLSVAASKGKLGKERVFTSSFSIMYVSDDIRTSFKFLFREGATEEQIAEATNHFLDLLKEFNENKENSELNLMLAKLTRRSCPIIICYNEKEREAMILQPEQKLSLTDIANK